LASILTSCSVFGKSSVETLEYKVIKKSNGFEIREYKPYIAATTTVQGEFKTAQNKAFRVLAGYIFGDNKKNKKINMTAPVLQEKDEEEESQKIAMTAPVLQEKTEQGWSMTFSMPSKYSLADLPEPNTDKITFTKVDSKKFATIRFNGKSSEIRINNKTEELKKWIMSTKKFRIISNAIYAGYNPPWTIPYFRRNEILIGIKYL